MHKFITTVVLVLVMALMVNAQTKTDSEAMIASVIQMTVAHVPEDIIITKTSKCELTPEQIVKLKQSGVSDNVLRAMIKGSTDQSPNSFAPNVTEIGFHLMGGSTPVALTINVLKPQKTNMLGMAATMGFGKAKQKASVDGATAKVRTTNTKPSIAFYAPDGTSASEYVLIRLESKKDKREITVGRMSMLGGSVGFDENRIIKFAVRKSNYPRLDYISFDQPLEPGEYAFYPANGLQSGTMSVNVVGKLYEFGIDK